MRALKLLILNIFILFIIIISSQIFKMDDFHFLRNIKVHQNYFSFYNNHFSPIIQLRALFIKFVIIIRGILSADYFSSRFLLQNLKESSFDFMFSASKLLLLHAELLFCRRK